MVSVRLQLEGGQEIPVLLREDAPELMLLFQILASRGNDALEPIEKFLQLPLENGKAACSFHSRQLVSVITEPPVIVQLQMPPARPTPPGNAPAMQQASGAPFANPADASPMMVHTPRCMIIDDFLTPDEHDAMLAYALDHEGEFESGTVEGKSSPHRQNKVIMGFAETTLSRLLQNRLLSWFPCLASQLELEPFALRYVESQLTASNDGHYYRLHCDVGPGHVDARVLTCVYYFFRQPRPFSGGALRLYDVMEQGGRRQPATRYQAYEPVSNRMLVFRSDVYHELMRIRCPSRQFGDSRFAVTNWFITSKAPDPEARFGWGHLRYGVAPAQFAG